MLNLLIVVSLGVLLSMVFVKQIGSLFSQTKETSQSHLSLFFKLIKMRMTVLLGLGVLLLVVILKLDIKAGVADMAAIIPGIQTTQTPAYQNGDLFVHEGITYTLIEKQKYRKDNLAGVAKEILLDGIRFYLVRKPVQKVQHSPTETKQSFDEKAFLNSFVD